MAGRLRALDPDPRRVDAGGALDLALNFDDLAAALARLDELWATESGVGANAALRVLDRTLQTIVTGRLEDNRDLLTPDVVFEDRRVGLANRIEGIDAMMEISQVLARMAPTTIEVTPLALPRATGWRWPCSRSTGASDLELVVLQVVRTDADGRVDLYVSFDPADLAAAIDHAEELYAAGEGADLDRHRRFYDLALAGRFDDIAALTTPDYVLEDRRAGVAHRIEGRDALIERLHVVQRLGLRSVDVEVIAARGERLALLRVRYLGDFENEVFTVYGTDDQGGYAGACCSSPKTSSRRWWSSTSATRRARARPMPASSCSTPR